MECDLCKKTFEEEQPFIFACDDCEATFKLREHEITSLTSERDSLRKRMEELEALLDQTNKSRSLELQRMNRLEVTIIDLQEELRSARRSFQSGNLIVNLPEKVDPLSPMHYVDGTPHEGEEDV